MNTERTYKCVICGLREAVTPGERCDWCAGPIQPCMRPRGNCLTCDIPVFDRYRTDGTMSLANADGSWHTCGIPEVKLTIGGVVQLPSGGYLHPYVLRDMCTEEAWKEFLSRPRVVCEYDIEEENKNG